MAHERPETAAVWAAFADRNGGAVDRDSKDRVKAIHFEHAGWPIVVDRYTVSTGQAHVTYTRARAGYRAQTPFRCKVWKQGLLSRIGKKLGMQDLVVGHPVLDRDFVIQSDSPGVARSLLAGSRVGELLLRDTKLQYGVGKRKRQKAHPDDAPDAEVVVRIAEVVKDGGRLDIMLALCRESLDALLRSGAALPASGRYAG
ncbi:MAG TPA: hypothetical protein VJ957_04670 [Longimicrobiales bacterium]|nr:hypothetical protein [Longimicrobiales bacterium]